MWLSGLSTGLQTKKLLVRFLVRVHPGFRVRSQVGDVQKAIEWCFSPSLPLSLKINKYNLRKKNKPRVEVIPSFQINRHPSDQCRGIRLGPSPQLATTLKEPVFLWDRWRPPLGLQSSSTFSIYPILLAFFPMGRKRIFLGRKMNMSSEGLRIKRISIPVNSKALSPASTFTRFAHHASCTTVLMSSSTSEGGPHLPDRHR